MRYSPRSVAALLVLVSLSACNSDDSSRSEPTTCDQFRTAVNTARPLTVEPRDAVAGDTLSIGSDEPDAVLDGYLVSTDPTECRVYFLKTDQAGEPAGWEDVTSGLPDRGGKAMVGPPVAYPHVRVQVPKQTAPGTYLLCGSTTTSCADVTIS